MTVITKVVRFIVKNAIKGLIFEAKRNNKKVNKLLSKRAKVHKQCYTHMCRAKEAVKHAEEQMHLTLTNIDNKRILTNQKVVEVLTEVEKLKAINL